MAQAALNNLGCGRDRAAEGSQWDGCADCEHSRHRLLQRKRRSRRWRRWASTPTWPQADRSTMRNESSLSRQHLRLKQRSRRRCVVQAPETAAGKAALRGTEAHRRAGVFGMTKSGAGIRQVSLARHGEGISRVATDLASTHNLLKIMGRINKRRGSKLTGDSARPGLDCGRKAKARRKPRDDARPSVNIQTGS